MIFRNSWQGKLIIEKILSGSPISQEKNAPQVGETVIRIAGREVDAASPLQDFFNGAEGSSIPLVVADQNGKERTLELVPISYDEARLLDQQAKLESALASCGKRIAYLPFRKMNTDHLRGLSVEIYRASLSADGLILDLRDNGGGRVTDQLLDLFTQPTHSFTIPRNGERGYPNDRRTSPAWDKPMVVLCNENTYSNAEIFCHAFKHIKRGKLIGKPTNGGVISAVSISIPEVGKLQIPFRGWFHIETGKDLELNGAVPDLIVPIPLSDQVRDQDPQLATAVKFLQKEIETPIKEVPAILKSAR
jgi:tricorn protease